MRLIRQLIEYFQARGVLPPLQLQKLQTNFLDRTGSGPLSSPGEFEEPFFEDDGDNCHEKAEEEKDREDLELESRLDARRPVRSRMRKKASGKHGKAARSEDFRPALESLAQRLDGGLGGLKEELEALLRLSPFSCCGRWEETAAALVDCDARLFDAALAEALSSRKVTPDALWWILAIDLAAMAGPVHDAVRRAYRTLIAVPESARPGRTKWGHRLLAFPALSQAVALAKAQRRLSGAWCRLCAAQTGLVFSALQACPHELGLWTLALMHTAKKLFPLDCPFASAASRDESGYQPVGHFCPADLWSQAWARVLQTEAADVFALLVRIDQELPYQGLDKPLPGEFPSCVVGWDPNMLYDSLGHRSAVSFSTNCPPAPRTFRKRSIPCCWNAGWENTACPREPGWWRQAIGRRIEPWFAR